MLCILAPGPDTLTIMALGLSRGRLPAAYFGAGCAFGCITHTTWAVLGVSAAIAASPTAFTILKCCGAAYLAYLGFLILTSKREGFSFSGNKPTSAGEPWRFLLRGFLSNATNPKVSLFFLAFLPQFLDRNRNVPLQIMILGVTFIALGLAIFTTLAVFAGQIGTWLRSKPKVARGLDIATGGLFLGLAARLALAR